MTVGFSYGPLCNSLEEQANEQGFTLGERAEEFEEYKCAINILYLSNIATESIEKKLREKLQKMFVRELKPLNR